jgi:hypothetical protein
VPNPGTGTTPPSSLCVESFRDPEEGASDTRFHVHLGRSWVGKELEADCPCGKAACGLVDSEQIDPECPQHALDAAKTMRQAHDASACPVPHEPDEMGVHSDDGIVWLPKSRYTRSQALTWYASFTGIRRCELTVRSQWMIHDPQPDEPEWWALSSRKTPGAFPVWRCE